MKPIIKKVILLFLFLLTPLLVMSARYPATLNAFDPDYATTMPGPTVLIRLDPQIRPRYVAPPISYQLNRSHFRQSSSATINVNYIGSGWTPEAQAAFEFAADIWETLVVSPVPIVVNAEFSPLGPGILGGAGPITIFRDFANAPRANTWYTVATANHLAQTDLDPSTADIQATFNSSFTAWYFGTDSSTPSNKVNFATIVLHELGHGLGFTGSMRIDNGSGNSECTGTNGLGCFGYDNYPFIYDHFTENNAGTPLINLPNNSTILASQLTSGAVYFDGPNARSTNGGRIPLYAPSTWQPGSSYSHLGEAYNDTAQALMTFSISAGETVYNPGAVTLCMFADMDWTVNEACQGDAIKGLLATNNGPTQLGTATQFKATITGGSSVSYSWDFGDGSSAGGADPAHQYAAPGSYTATVTASNAGGQETAATTVIVEAPIAGLSAANNGPSPLGSATQFQAIISGGSNVSYAWDFGDGSSAGGADPAHQYAAPGSYTATVTASNSIGQETAATTVLVEAPIAGLAAANNGPSLLGSATQFQATIDGGSNVSYSWDFGDGKSATGAVVDHQYAAPGSYTATVTASNAVGQEIAVTDVNIEEALHSILMPMLANSN